MTKGPARVGLEILYARPGSRDRLEDVEERDLTGELRERYWIRQAGEAGLEAKSWTNMEMTVPWSIERSELGRNRNEPGDGFRYVFRSGTGGTGGRVEWFEVTEVFVDVKARDIESFMRLENGMVTRAGFDPEGFVRGLNLGIPRRTAQRRAADKVIRAVERKMAKSSYQRMWRNYGYGTLIVGLPLWFATDPLDPLRVENVIDDFMTRVQVGLEPYARQLRRKSCRLLADRGRLEGLGGEYPGVEAQGTDGRLRGSLLSPDRQPSYQRRVAAAASRVGGGINARAGERRGVRRGHETRSGGAA